MALGEQAGAVYVSIDGDASPLIAKFAQVQQISTAAGQKIAAGLGAGLATSTGLVDQFGRSIAATVSPVNALSASVGAAAASETRLAVSTEEANVALGHQVSQMQAVGGAIRTGLGEQSIRAAERFLTLIPGVGAALQVAFPVIGAIALAEAFGRALGEGEALKKSIEELGKATKAADDDFSHMVQTLDRLNAGAIGRDLGPAAEARTRSRLLAMEADDARNKIRGLAFEMVELAAHATDASRNPKLLIPIVSEQIQEETKNKIKAIREQIDGLNAGILAKEKESQDALLDAKKTGLQDQGTLEAQAVKNQSSEATKSAELARKKAEIWIASEHSLRQQIIDADRDADQRTVDSAAEQLRVAVERSAKLGAIDYAETQQHIAQIQARAAAESLGKTPVEVRRIQTGAAGEIAGLRSDQQQKELDLHAAVLDAGNKLDEAKVVQQRTVMERWAEEVRKGFSQLASEWKAGQARVSEFAVKQADDLGRINAIAAKSAGSTQAAGIESRKLDIERAYGLEIAHSGRQQLVYLVQIHAMEDRVRLTKVNTLRAQADELNQDKEAVQVAQLRAEAAALEEQSANKRKQETTEELELQQRLTLQYRLRASLRNAGAAVPGAIGGALAGGLLGGGHQNIGQQIAQSLRGVGQQLLGGVFTHLITTIIANTVGQTALGAFLGLNATTTAVHSGVMLTHAGVMLTHLGVMVSNTLAVLGNTLATIWNTIVEIAKSLFGFADGGSPPVGIPSIVGERGPELFIPKEAGTVVPNHMLKGYADGAGMSLLQRNTNMSGDMHFHAHGMQNPAQFVREVAKQIPHLLKTQLPGRAQYAR